MDAKAIFDVIPLHAIVLAMINHLSDLAKAIRPDEIDPETAKKMQKWVGTLYAILVYHGPDLVASSSTDLDDAALQEALEIIHDLADTYSLCLNPIEIEVNWSGT